MDHNVMFTSKKYKLLLSLTIALLLSGCASQNADNILFGSLNGAINGYSLKGLSSENTVINGALRGALINTNCHPITALCNSGLYTR